MDDLEEGEIEDCEVRPPHNHTGSRHKANFDTESRSQDVYQREFWSDEPVLSFDYNHGFEQRGIGGFGSKRRPESSDRQKYGPISDHRHILPITHRERSSLRDDRTYDRHQRYGRISEKQGYACRPYFDVGSESRAPSTKRMFGLSEPMRHRNEKRTQNEKHFFHLKPTLDRTPRYQEREGIRRDNYTSNDLQPGQQDPTLIDKRQGQISLLNIEDEFQNRMQKLSQESNKDGVQNLKLNDKGFVSKSEISFISQQSSKACDEYDLDDFELLLERHRLIQQQLSAIGRQERNLKEKLSNNHFFDDISDFVTIPNPNVIEIDNQVITEPSEQQLTARADGLEQQHFNLVNSDLETRQSNFNDNQLSFQFSQRNSRTDKFQDSNTDNLTEDNDVRIISPVKDTNESVDPLVNNEKPDIKLDDQRIVVQKKAKRKRFHRTGRPSYKEKRERAKLKKLNLAAAAKHQELLSAKRRESWMRILRSEQASVQNEPSVENGCSVESTSKDNYQAIPMDLEEEYEDIDRLIEEDYYTKDAEEPVSLEAQKSSDNNCSVEDKQDAVTESDGIAAVVDKEKATFDVITISDSESQTEKATTTEPEDDHDDDLLLRQQLLHSLATKRAEKAKAIIAEQPLNSPSTSPIPGKSKVIKGKTSTTSNLPTSTTSSLPTSTTSSLPILFKVKSSSNIQRNTKSPVTEKSFSLKEQQLNSPSTSPIPDKSKVVKRKTSTTSSLPTSTASRLPTSTTSSLPTSTASSLPTSTTSSLPTSTTSSLPTSTTSSLPILFKVKSSSNIQRSTKSPVTESFSQKEQLLNSPPTSQIPDESKVVKRKTLTTSSLRTSTTSSLPTSTTSSLPTSTTSSLPTSTASSLPTSTTTSLPILFKVKSNSNIQRNTKSPVTETSFSQKHEKVIIQIGNDSDSDEDGAGTETEAVSDFFSGAISDLLHEARHGTKAATNRALPAKSIRDSTKIDGPARSVASENAELVGSLQKCILDAHLKLENHRADARKDESTMKVLLKKISARKSKVEQQSSKIDRLKNLLSNIEKSRKTLTSQCSAFEEQAKLLNRRINLRTEKSSSLEEELLRARSIVSTTKKRDSLIDSPQRVMASGSPSCSDGGRSSSDVEGSSMLNEQIKLSIQKMKLAIVKKSSELASSAARSRLPSKRKIRQENEEPVKKSKQSQPKSTASPLKNEVGRSDLQNTKEKLQILERELREKLGRMKALSVMKLNKREKNAAKKDNVATSVIRDVGFRTEVVTQAKEKIRSGPTNDREKGSPGRNIQNMDLLTIKRTVLNEGVDKQPEKTIDPIPSRVKNKNNIIVLDVDESREMNNSQSDNANSGKKDNFDSNNRSFDKDEGDESQVEKEYTELQALLLDEIKLKKLKEQQLKQGVKTPHYKGVLLSCKKQKMFQDLKDVIEKNLMNNDMMFIGNFNRNSSSNNESRKKATQNLKYHSYSSPLLCFKSYRLCPYFRTREKISISSNTYSNKINSRESLCPYDLAGQCLDKNCKEQHASSVLNQSEDELLGDLIMYEPSVADITTKDTQHIIKKKIEVFVTGLRRQYKNKMNIDQLALLLVNRIKGARKEKADGKYSYYNNVEMKKRLSVSRQEMEKTKDNIADVKRRIWNFETMKNIHSPEKAETQEVRYFQEEYDVKRQLESLVADNPLDVTSWIALAKKNLISQSVDRSQGDNVEKFEHKALNILSRALEANPTSEDLWFVYLDLFSKKDCNNELRDLCMQAVEYCRSYTVWWKVLQLERKQENKIEICLEVMDFVVENSEQSSAEIKSHRLLETLLYMVQLEISKDNVNSALDMLCKSLWMPSNEHSSQEYLPVLYNELLIGDLVILWLCYLSFSAFESLPSCLFDPSDSRPSKIVSKRVFLLDWGDVQNTSVQRLQKLFKDALRSIKKHPGFTKNNVCSLLPLYEHFQEFEMKKGDPLNGLVAIRELADIMKSSRELKLLLFKTMTKISTTDEVILFAESDKGFCLLSDEFAYEYAQWLLSKCKRNQAIKILNEAALRKFKLKNRCSRSSSDPENGRFGLDPLLCYRRLLNISTELVKDLPSISEDAKISNKDREHAFIWLNYCLLLDINTTTPLWSNARISVNEAFEIAVDSYTSSENRKILWQKYLLFSLKSLEPTDSKLTSMKTYLDLRHRCLTCMPSNMQLPLGSNECWNDFTFHNLLIRDCLEILPESQVGFFLEENLRMMPMNIELAIRACHFEMESGNLEQARNIYGFILKKYPNSLEMWKLAISVELKSDGIREARWLYEEATKMLPYYTAIWKDRVLFEIAHGSSVEAIRKSLMEIAKRGKDYGMDIMVIVKSLLQ